MSLLDRCTVRPFTSFTVRSLRCQILESVSPKGGLTTTWSNNEMF